MLLMVQSTQIYRCCSYSVLDMVVTNYLYHAPGKEYSPGHMHLRKSAVVNTHFLAYICLRCSLSVETSMPRPNGNGGVSVQSDTQVVYLWQCLLHSSPRILDDFKNTFPRFQKSREEIEGALTQEAIFPWAALTRTYSGRRCRHPTSRISFIRLGIQKFDGDRIQIRKVQRHHYLRDSFER